MAACAPKTYQGSPCRARTGARAARRLATGLDSDTAQSLANTNVAVEVGRLLGRRGPARCACLHLASQAIANSDQRYGALDSRHLGPVARPELFHDGSVPSGEVDKIFTPNELSILQGPFRSSVTTTARAPSLEGRGHPLVLAMT